MRAISLSSTRLGTSALQIRVSTVCWKDAQMTVSNRRLATRCQAIGGLSDDQPANDDDVDYAAVASRLNNLMGINNLSSDSPRLTGTELRECVYKRFKRTYDVRLRRIGTKVYLQIMWRFLEQKSFPLTPEEYDDQLDAVAELLTEWGVAGLVRDQIKAQKVHPGYTVGGGARCVSIPLPVDTATLAQSGFT